MSPKKPFRHWPLVAIGTVALVMLLSNQTASLPQGGAAVANAQEFDALMAQMMDLSKNRIAAYDAGQTLSVDDKAKLRKAGDLVRRLSAFSPTASNLYFVGGKVHQILGENDVAEENFRQCVFNAPDNARREPAHERDILAISAQASYQLSLLLMARGDVKDALGQADAAVKLDPRSSDYHTAHASALNELRQTDEAKKELLLALELDPKNARAASLLKFISH